MLNILKPFFTNEPNIKFCLPLGEIVFAAGCAANRRRGIKLE